MRINAIEKSHSYWVDVRDPTVKGYIWRYLKRITSVKWEKKGNSKIPMFDKTYATKSPCGNYVGILHSCFNEMITFIKDATRADVKVVITDKRTESVAKFDMTIKDGVDFLDTEQEEAYEFLTKDYPLHILQCRTGFGKTFLGIYSSAIMGVRTAFMMQPKHIKTWLDDIPNFVDIEKTDVLVVRGKAGIKNAIAMQRLGKLKAKFIFIASDTFREYIKSYESGECYDDITPIEFFEFMGIGRVVRDEAHEALYSLVTQNLYLNVKSLLCLSATIVSEDNFITAMYDRIFPKKFRWLSKNNDHIEAYSVRYFNEYGLKIKSQYGYGYSHVRYEKEILKRVRLREQYFNMIADTTYNFELDYEKGMKMIIFCALTDMCKWMAEKFSKHYPNLKCNYYIAETPDEVLKESDVIVTTIGSCGTGKNIINLMHTYNTVAIGSKKQAWQVLGRLRKPKNYKHKAVKYYFFSNMSIPAHRKFESKRSIDLLDKTKFIKNINLGVTLKSR